MLNLAGTPGDNAIAVEGSSFAAIAVAPPGGHDRVGPGMHADGKGVLVWAGEMFLPAGWLDDSTSATPTDIAAIVRHKLLLDGPEILAEIDGSFCGAWFDAREQAWVVFNDRWGLIPVFWWSDGAGLIVSPKARITWQASGTALNVDERGVADLVRTQNMLDDHTLIAGVHWLEPASCLTWDGTQARRQRYWGFQHQPPASVAYDDVLEQFVESSRATMARMTDTNTPILQGISGGLDSRMFLAVCHELGRVPACYTSGFAYSEDMRFGRRLARAAGASHEALPLDERWLADQVARSIAETDGLHGAGHLVMSAPIAAHLERREGALLIEGYLHGVLGGSDLPADEDVPSNRPAHEHTWARDFLHSGGEPALIDGLLRPELACESRSRWAARVDDAFGRSRTADPLCRAEYAIISGRSGRNDVLVPAMFRRYATVRHPACDRTMVQWYAAAPAAMRRARKAYIDVLGKYYPRFARVPRADGCSGMPLSAGRWSREYHWKLEKLYSLWARLRYPAVRRWGRDSVAARAWAFEVLRRAGAFEPMLDPHARICEWVRPESLRDLWEVASRDPRRSVPLFSLWTIESTIRRLESESQARGMDHPIIFRVLRTAGLPSRECVEVV